ncbi:MAG: heme o synthase [Verrucomicrobia bacterium]|nr:heme o synthase [Verrucomicrobiota bacterium]MDA1068025.1 heme o synthase [Verrucomicrobiota bacterium]
MSLGEPKLASIESSSTVATEAVAKKTRLADYIELTKPRLSLMSIITALLGYFAAGPEKNLPVFFALTIGTSLAAAGAAILNQWYERKPDSLMERTSQRPLPRGVILPATAFILGTILSIAGIAILFVWTHVITAWLGLATVLIYIVIYTPLKRVTPLSTEIGALPGAIPPLMGWVAAEGNVTTLGWVLFGILLTWQMPHFMAISWMYREDYQRGGFRMLVLANNGAVKISYSALIYTILLIAITMVPVALSITGPIYAIGATALSAFIGFRAWQFFKANDKDQPARNLFFSSIIHLPLLFAVLVVDRWVF